MKQCSALFLVSVLIVSAAGVCLAGTCRRSCGAGAPSATAVSSASVSSPACGSGATIVGTPGVSGRVSTRSGGSTAHKWKGGTYKHPGKSYRR